MVTACLKQFRRSAWVACTSLATFLVVLVASSPLCFARDFEMMGIVHSVLSQHNPKPPSFQDQGGGLGYAFFGRLEVGPGMIETGFSYLPTSMTVRQVNQSIEISGSYWTLPLLYRVELWAPYVSFAAGMDYGIVGGTQVSVNGPLQGATVNYVSHFGAVASLQIKQDVGENLSLMLDVRYRVGMRDALSVPDPSQGISTASTLRMTSIGIGLVKHLED